MVATGMVALIAAKVKAIIAAFIATSIVAIQIVIGYGDSDCHDDSDCHIKFF